MQTPFVKVPIDQLDVHSFQELQVKEILSLKDQLFLQLLQQLTGRELIVDSDIEDIQIIKREADEREWIAYKGSLVGYIDMKHGYDASDFKDNKYSIGWEFVPQTDERKGKLANKVEGL